MIKVSYECHLSTDEQAIVFRSKEGRFFMFLDESTPPFPYISLNKEKVLQLIDFLQKSIKEC